jgi:hypothetical protein
VVQLGDLSIGTDRHRQLSSSFARPVSPDAALESAGSHTNLSLRCLHNAGRTRIEILADGAVLGFENVLINGLIDDEPICHYGITSSTVIDTP